MNTTSHPDFQATDCTHSRRRLFTRLRTTAFPTRLLIEKPNLLGFNSLEKAFITSNSFAQDLPWL